MALDGVSAPGILWDHLSLTASFGKQVAVVIKIVPKTNKKSCLGETIGRPALMIFKPTLSLWVARHEFQFLFAVYYLYIYIYICIDMRCFYIAQNVSFCIRY